MKKYDIGQKVKIKATPKSSNDAKKHDGEIHTILDCVQLTKTSTIYLLDNIEADSMNMVPWFCEGLLVTI